ncbi:MAG: hypothetical protein Q7K43_00530, partial [Candidatus Woesearchaeota archaeon]|nr:hypothetical protein [Candidatus Woesearchaeota archaeon]
RITILFRQSFRKRGERVIIENEEQELVQIGRHIITRNIVSGQKKHWAVAEFESSVKKQDQSALSSIHK